MKLDVQVPDRGTMIRELEQRKLRNTQASVAFGSAKVGKRVIAYSHGCVVVDLNGSAV